MVEREGKDISNFVSLGGVLIFEKVYVAGKRRIGTVDLCCHRRL